jgi:hypothetical protein
LALPEAVDAEVAAADEKGHTAVVYIMVCPGKRPYTGGH